MLSKQLRELGVSTFPCWLRRDDRLSKWVKGPAIPRGESWVVAATRPYGDPALNWSSGVFGIPIPEGIVIIDLDSYKGVTPEQVDALLGVRLPWAAAHIQRTIGGGDHYAFRVDWPVKQGDSIAGLAGFDTRCAQKGFICSGEGYTQIGFGVMALGVRDALPELPDACRPLLEAHTPTPAPATPSDQLIDADAVLEALRFINPQSSRADWLRIGLALRHAYANDPEAGLEVFNTWSSGGLSTAGTPHNYEPDRIEKDWYSFKPEGATTVSTIYYRAIQNGWNPPRLGIDASTVFGVQPDRFEGLITLIDESGADIRQTEAILESIRGAGCSPLQLALLAAQLKTALKAGGIKDTAVARHIDVLLSGAAPYQLQGATLTPGQILDHDTPIHPSAWAAQQTKGKQLKPKATLTNFEIMLAAYGIDVEFDVIAKVVTVKGPGVSQGGALHDEAALAYLESLCNLNEYPAASLRSMLMAVANRSAVNPVQDYVSSQVWDGRDHVGHLFHQLVLDPSEDARFAELLFRKWLRGAYSIGVGRLRRWEYVLVLVDPNGGAGKTRFFSTLCPEHLRKDSVILDVGNKDSVKMAISYWLCELGELDGTFNRSEQARIKAFLSQEADEMRLAYGRAYLKYPRHTAFMASVNENHFLLDPSHNRRMWPIEVTAANHLHTVDVAQMWAQVAHEVAAGQQCHLTPQEEQILTGRNESFRSGSVVVDRLSALAIVEDPHNCLTCTEVLSLAGLGNPNKLELNECARYLRRVGHREGREGNRRGFCVRVESPSVISHPFKIAK